VGKIMRFLRNCGGLKAAGGKIMRFLRNCGGLMARLVPVVSIEGVA